ncbi:calcium-binding protein [Streptococcus parasanguinis]|uniref:Calcium-binding protein n=1 Tax=Streptococcus parasanguinis TaxID=1318 RepID=A0A7X2X100_STRPA|nr:calcium-binding protein [Streptococcus parasanguinis]MTR66908.1 calcium-binding protein [Streptococcus parasanguinis]
MKKFVDYIMAQPVWKVVLYGLGILLMIFNPKIILPLLFFGGIGFAWYFAKKKPNATKRNIAAIASILAVGGAYLIDPNIASTKQEEQAQATHFASTPSKNDESAKKEAEAKREKEAKEKAEKEKAEKAEKAEKEKKAKEEQERKEKEEREKKAKEEQERKEKEEREKKEAEAKQLAAQAESAVQALENNQVTENIAPAQAAIANVADQGTKDRLTHRVGLVQNAITVRAQQAEQARQAAAAEQARQAAAAQQTQQQQAQNQTVSGGGYYRDARGRWHRPNGQFASKKEIASIGLAW